MNATTNELVAQILAQNEKLLSILTAASDESTPVASSPKPRQPKAAKAKKAPKREISAAATHCRNARLARREANPTTAHGLTKAEKSYLYHTYADYSAAVVAYKALTPAAQKKVLAGGNLRGIDS